MKLLAASVVMRRLAVVHRGKDTFCRKGGLRMKPGLLLTTQTRVCCAVHRDCAVPGSGAATTHGCPEKPARFDGVVFSRSPHRRAHHRRQAANLLRFRGKYPKHVIHIVYVVSESKCRCVASHQVLNGI